MTTTFSSTPYFDDFDEDKQFYRVLFKPGRAVQARELTQLQTISQDQIQRFGNHIFKNGSIVEECAFALDLKIEFLKIKDLTSTSADIDVTTILKGFTLTGLTSGVTGSVETTLDGVETASNTKTIFFKYTAANGATSTFANNEQIEIRNTTGTLVSTVVSLASAATGKGSAFSLGDGIIYVNGVFLKHLSQTIILDRYTITPSFKIGITLEETIVNSEADESLLDPALGSSNYFAAGADRFKIATVLTKKSIDDEDTEDFYLLYEVLDGEERRAYQRAQYSVIQDEIANRTFEESGNYVVKPFLVRIRDHLKTATNGGLYLANTDPAFIGGESGNSNLLVFGVEPGIGYVRGYRAISKLTEYVVAEKGIKFASENLQPISFGYGNYIEVNEISGPWNVDNGTQISLRSANARAITNETYGSTGAPGIEIGTARVKSVVYESGNIGLAASEYRIYLYDVNLTANVPFANVRSIYFNAGSGSDSIGDVVLTSNIAVVEESNFDTGIFKFPQRAIKTLRDPNGAINNVYEFKKSFDVTVAVDGTFTVTSSIANEVFPFSLGSLNATQKRDNFVLVFDQAQTTTNLTGTIDLSNTSPNISANVTTAFNTQLKAGDRILTAGGNTYRIATVTSATALILDSNAIGTESNVTYQKVFAIGEYIDLSESGSSGSVRDVNLLTATTVSVDLEESLSSTVSAKILVNLQKTDSLEIQKTLRQNRFVKIDCSTAGTLGKYNLGFSDIFRVTRIFHGTTFSESNTDVTRQFVLDDGQRDSLYTHGRIIQRNNSTLTLTSASRILIKLDYFFHDTSSGVGFLSSDSYPIDDTTDTFRTEDIPIFISPKTGERFDLRDSIDIRPRFSDTSADATSIGSATVNPTAPVNFNVPSGGLRVAVPNEEFNTDLEYYLARKDVVYIDKSGQFGIETGLSEIRPITPNAPPDTMSLAVVSIPPYPSLSPQVAKLTGRTDYEVSLRQLDNRRYTMSDIGAINQRINRLEYYTSISLLALDAKDKVVPSDVTGLDRFKNGILVDNFKGHGIGNPRDINYKISIDPLIGEMRPSFNIDNLDLKINTSETTGTLRAPRDAEISLTTVTGTFTSGQTLTQGSITGKIVHVVGTKLYVENTTGLFTAGSVSSPTASATIITVVLPAEGDLVTLPYTHLVYASQSFATKPRNCVGDLLFIWNGEIELSPPADNWTDTNTRPDLVVNFDNNLDNWLALDQAWGTQWGDWTTNWSGETSSRTVLASTTDITDAPFDPVRGILRTAATTEFAQVTTTVEERQTRLGTNLQVVPETVNYDLGNRVVDVSIVPFIREQILTFSASRMKPNVIVHAFFDGENVDTHCRLVGGNLGGTLQTNSTGGLVGEFRIPNNNALRFRIGQRLFKLTDDILDRAGFTTTFAAEVFNAFGIQQTQERTILSSRQARVSFTTESDSRSLVTTAAQVERVERVESDYFDPIAQTFVVSVIGNGQGIFLTKMDVFFRTKSSTLPITLQIREVVNGFPGPRVLPFGSVTLFPPDINLSEDASAPTVFTFPSPVFLQDAQEYCFVLLPAGNNPDYNVWVAELGENQLGTNNRVSEAPFLGVLFTSSNNRAWTPVQAEDIKFNIYRANFVINTSGSLVLNNDNSDYVQISNLSGGLFRSGDPVRFSSGTGTLLENNSIDDVVKINKASTLATIRGRVDPSGNITANTSSNVVVGAGTLFNTQAYANSVIYSSNVDTRIGKIISIIDDNTVVIDSVSPINITANSFILFDEIVNISNTSIFATAENIDDKFISLFHTNFAYLDFVTTEVTSQYRIRDSFDNTISSYDEFKINEDYYLESEAKVASDSNENVFHGNTKSLAVKVDIKSFSNFVSPAFDLLNASFIIVHNLINNDATNETLNAGNALARYISKMVTLDEGQDSEDLKVFLTGYRPPNTDIKVFTRLLNNDDNTPFSDGDYIEMEKVTSNIVFSNPSNTTDYKEFEYVIPSTSLTGPNGEVQYTRGGNTFTGFKHFSIKIVLLGTNSSIVPKVKNYRAIALQI